MNDDTNRFIAAGLNRGIACCASKRNESLDAAADECTRGQAEINECSHWLWVARYRKLKRTTMKRRDINEIVATGIDFNEVWDSILAHPTYGMLARSSHWAVGFSVAKCGGICYIASVICAD